MTVTFRLFRWVSVALVCSVALCDDLLLPERISLDSLAGFRPPPPNWRLAGGLGGDPRRERTFVPTDGLGLLIALPVKGKDDILTAWEHGDLDLELEYLLPVGSNSGVYLMGRYEVQLYDSWGVAAPSYVDNGSIYQRYDETRPEGQRSYDGHKPRANASRAPGLWQHLRVEFEAPRFDSSGKKVRNARFKRVILNDFTVQENVEISGPTRAPTFHDERPTGPLMLQGDHGPVAFRNIRYKRYDTQRLTVDDLKYRLYPGEYSRIGEYDQATPSREGVPPQFAADAVEKSGKFALVFTGTFTVPRDGTYGFKVPFHVLSGSTVQLTIDNKLVVVPTERGSHPGTITLTQGRHPFRFDLLQAGPTGPAMELIAEGPGMASHTVTASTEPREFGEAAREVLIEVKDRVVVQRSFVPFEPRKRLYGVNVGTPAGVHYAYDFETGALLHAWRGRFLNAAMMWNGRGNGQIGRAAGPGITFAGLPLLTLIEYGQVDPWPDDPDPLWMSKGYKIGSDGVPTFRSKLAELNVVDRIAPSNDGKGLTRTIQVNGELSAWSTWVLLAEADQIQSQPDGKGWIIGDRVWYLDWPSASVVTPVLRSNGGRQQLAVPLSRGILDQPITYTIVW